MKINFYIINVNSFTLFIVFFNFINSQVCIFINSNNVYILSITLIFKSFALFTRFQKPNVYSNEYKRFITHVNVGFNFIIYCFLLFAPVLNIM